MFSTAEITAFIGALIWPFIRISAMMLVAPVFSAKSVPVKVRVAAAMAMTLVVMPVLPPLPLVDFISGEALLIAVHQVLIGAIMGFALQLAFNLFVMAGHILAMQAGLGFSMMNSPQDGVQVTVVGQLYLMLATLLYLALDGHLILIREVLNSFTLLPIGAGGISPAGYWMLVSWGSTMFLSSVMIVLPAITALLMVNVSFGVMSKASPQLNPFSVGFLITIILAFAIIYITLPTLIPHFEKIMTAIFQLIQDILQQSTASLPTASLCAKGIV
ncbi:MAG: flagellar biosynthetic protein FliR [gamma proteobacterium symbiont of Bathyaustriella thionipta]|nr:flagellar biosynthetic protein FliR [gamma proteobacterium symbiont of Bathyaustriella thionipta]MCU7950743.1 flagellar biosynthetic protein FliR [gamma proteobacterium symbiont of Bathyaustriella thionipta]MCU7952438.1 flagellar biosynthetic protein FliR [gamma proteobacterium symbiont of Bathyaustriella thionipta]MCU7957234.1 flagellar biosynthetic protein FliR [gamma proteobacterium symbiont of Bathyaustriella thionipta]MCU7968764.1 flagellar biosynthetic protein FliR [gamma proteobacteri